MFLYFCGIVYVKNNRNEEGNLIGVKLTLVGSPLIYSDSLTESG